MNQVEGREMGGMLNSQLGATYTIKAKNEKLGSHSFSLDGNFTRYLAISLVLSSMASSMLMSMTEAPSSICPAAICTASSYFPSEIRRANFLDPGQKRTNQQSAAQVSPTVVAVYCALVSMEYRHYCRCIIILSILHSPQGLLLSSASVQESVFPPHLAFPACKGRRSALLPS